MSDEHRAARREQIVLAALRCVVREGFHKTTMADVIRESGLSAGAVYGYFKSKNEIIAAIADRAIGTIDEVFAELLGREPLPDLPEVLASLTDRIERLGAAPDGDMTRVALPVWAEALRDPVVREVAAGKYRQIRGRFAELAARLQQTGRVDPQADPGDVAQVLFGAIIGYIVQRLILGDVTPRSYPAGLAAVVTDPRAADRVPPPSPQS